jgi:DNA end-binding protein Ku
VARSVWKGTLVIGKLAIPAALQSAAQHDDVVFKSLHRTCGTPIRQTRFCPTCDVEVTIGAETVRAHEIAEGHFITVENDELELALGSKTIALEHFVPLSELPDIVDASYWLVPTPDEFATRAWVGLLQALGETELAGLGRLALYSKERAVSVRAIPWPNSPSLAEAARNGTGVPLSIVVQTLFLPTEYREPPRIDFGGGPGLTAASQKLFARVLKQRAKPTTTKRFEKRVEKLIEAKRRGDKAIVSPQPQISAPIDLEQTLKSMVKPSRAKPKPKAKA